MLHIHFGTGRLGLGLVAPFLQTPDSELFLLNRASSASKATGSTALDPARRNELLKNNSSKQYAICTPGSAREAREHVRYDGFFPYDEHNVQETIETILQASQKKSDGIVITGSVLTVKNYAPVVEALDTVCQAKQAEDGRIGEVYLIACENTVSAYEVLQHPDLSDLISPEIRRHVRCVHALVDRVCVDIEEGTLDGEPAVVIHAEEYGSLKLELSPRTTGIKELLAGSRAEFSHHLDVEKDIKSWLLNGSHWLIALTAFRETDGNAELKLNDFITSTRNHRLYAGEVIQEMRDGIEALLRADPQYAEFIKDVDVSAYLDGAASCILERFQANNDSIQRILARFRAPTPDEIGTVQSFIDRFLHRIEPPMLAYQAEKGVPPKSVTQGVFNLFRLQASGTYVDTAQIEHRKVA